jgi:DNA polymerase III epsilon subunit family exonuclease
MGTVLTILVVCLALWLLTKLISTAHGQSSSTEHDLSMLPERFVIFDLETTGLKAEQHEIIEIGAIRVNRDSDMHDTFQTLVVPKKRISKRITELTGIDRQMIDKDGTPLEEALEAFFEFSGDLPMIAYNAEFDEAFLRSACQQTQIPFPSNEICCALKMARRSWKDRKSYKLADIAKDGGLSLNDNHRALGDCRRTLTVYVAAASTLGKYR